LPGVKSKAYGDSGGDEYGEDVGCLLPAHGLISVPKLRNGVNVSIVSKRKGIVQKGKGTSLAF
jgi:hypothetical protein